MSDSYYYYSKELPRKTIEGTKSFTTLPIRIHRDDARAKKASQRFRAAWANASTDSKQLIPSLDTPLGKLVSLGIPECPPSRLELAARLAEYGFFENDLMDATEPQPGVPTQNDPGMGKTPFHIMSEWFASFNSKHKRLATELMVDILALEHPKLSQAYDSVREYWRYRRHVIKPTSWQEYLDYRTRQSGVLTCSIILCIAMDFDLDDEELDSVKHMTDPLMTSLALGNDYFSYAKEKDLPEENCVNGVKFLMQHEGMSEDTALNAVKVKVIELEQAHNVAFDEWLKGEQQSPELRRFLVAARLMIGGSHFGQAISPRYGHYNPGLSYYSQAWTCRLLVLSACVLLLAFLKLYGAHVNIGATFVGFKSMAIEGGLLQGNESPGGVL